MAAVSVTKYEGNVQSDEDAIADMVLAGLEDVHKGRCRKFSEFYEELLLKYQVEKV